MLIYAVIFALSVILVGIVVIYLRKPGPVPEIIPEVVKPPVEQLIPIQIYYGSQQGAAAKLAKILAQEGREHGFITNDVDLIDSSVTDEMVKGKVGIFCMATHGEGEPTDNAKQFQLWLEEKRPSLNGFRFTVFGLGNTQYEHFNRMGKQTNRILESQNAIRVYKYGEGDDNSSLEEDFNQWKEGLWEHLKIQLADLIAASKMDSTQAPIIHQSNKGYTMELTEEQEAPLDQGAKGEYDFQTKQFLKASNCPVVSIKELRQNLKDGSTLHIVIDTQNSGFQYRTAMNLGVFPENSTQSVQEVAAMIGEKLQNTYVLNVEQQQKKVKLPFPSPISVQNILSKFCDYSGPVMKKTLKDLAALTNDNTIKERLEYLASTNGKDDYTKEISKPKKTILNIIKEYQIHVNLAQFIELCPRISPRLFTIASSNLKYPNEVHLADSLMVDQLEDGSTKVGLCSQYFSDLKELLDRGMIPQVRVDFRESSFKLPDNPQTTVLMIGPGTGVAPFIGFLQEREIFLQNQQQKENKFILYFGCRHDNGDFIYKDTLLGYQTNKIVDDLYIAFSRDQANKVYVQDILAKHEGQIFELIKEERVKILICGSTSMGNSIVSTIVDMISRGYGQSNEDSMKMLQELEKQKIVVKELW